MELYQFDEITGLEWQTELNKLLLYANSSYRITNDTQLFVSDQIFFKQLKLLISETPTHVLYNFMGWITVVHNVDYLDEKLRNLKWQLVKNISNGDRFSDTLYLLPWRKMCFEFVDTVLSFPLVRIYVENFLRKDQKTKTLKMFENLKESVRQQLLNNVWLAESDRELLIENLNSIEASLLYPEFIMDDHLLDQFQNMLNGEKAECHFFDGLMLAKRKLWLKRFWLMNQKEINDMQG